MLQVHSPIDDHGTLISQVLDQLFTEWDIMPQGAALLPQKPVGEDKDPYALTCSLLDRR